MAQQDVADAPSAASSQFLTFLLGTEQYGVEILKVQEIRGYSAVTPIPNTPAFIRGIINLRGTVVPVIDLRARFAMDTAVSDRFTVIIMVTLGPKVVGLVVDAVSDVLDVPAADVRMVRTWALEWTSGSFAARRRWEIA